MAKDIQISTEKFSKIVYTKQGEGNILLLLHGFPENHTLWHKITPLLSEHFTIITPDIPGSGESILDNENASIEDLAETVTAIVKNEGITNMVLAGHSMGGYISLAFAEKYPSLLKGLSLIHSTATADDEEKKKKRQKSVELIRNDGKETFIKEMVPNLFAEKFRKENKDVISQQIQRGSGLKSESMISFYNAMMNRPDRKSILKTASYPVQMIIGKEETIAPMNVLLEQGAMADVNFVSVYKDSLHMSMIEQPDQLANDLINFTKYCYSRNT